MPQIHGFGQVPGETARDTATAIFSHRAIENAALSKKMGRPIFDQKEVVTVKFPADKQKTVDAYAHSVWKVINGQKVTYAERWADQYRRFKAEEAQVVVGTPLSEAPFLNVAQRATLRALGVHTVEQLSEVHGQSLKNLGPDGLSMQQAARAYIDKAAGTADVTGLAAENARLREMLLEMQHGAAPVDAASQVEERVEMTDEQLKAAIKEKTGAAPRGNPSRATLERMLAEA